MITPCLGLSALLAMSSYINTTMFSSFMPPFCSIWYAWHISACNKKSHEPCEQSTMENNCLLIYDDCSLLKRRQNKAKKNMEIIAQETWWYSEEFLATGAYSSLLTQSTSTCHQIFYLFFQLSSNVLANLCISLDSSKIWYQSIHCKKKKKTCKVPNPFTFLNYIVA